MSAEIESSFAKALAEAKPGFENDEHERAALAVKDALEFFARIPVQPEPLVDVTDDGIAVLQWLSDEGGIAVMFGGDGVATVSRSDATHYYGQTMRDFPIVGFLAGDWLKLLAAPVGTP